MKGFLCHVQPTTPVNSAFECFCSLIWELQSAQGQRLPRGRPSTTGLVGPPGHIIFLHKTYVPLPCSTVGCSGAGAIFLCIPSIFPSLSQLNPSSSDKDRGPPRLDLLLSSFCPLLPPKHREFHHHQAITVPQRAFSSAPAAFALASLSAVLNVTKQV